jgi:hypothetical protein
MLRFHPSNFTFHSSSKYAIVSRNGKLVRLQLEDIKPRAVAEEQGSYNSKS